MFSPIVIVSIVFSALYFLMVLYYFVGWVRVKSFKGDTSAAPLSVSIVIPVRNESAHIQDCLKAIFNQNYPAHLFEVIVIDDYSTDPTLRLAREFTNANLTVLDLQQYLGRPGEYTPNKKKAIALGVKNAKNKLIITTDGDCTMSENWLSSMVNFYHSNNYKLVTGPVMLKPARNPFAWFQQLDVMNLIGITGATVAHNFPVMCNGSNLMYEKETFMAVEGFKGNHDVPTGDDIFLMQKVKDKYPNSIGFAKTFNAAVFTKAETSLGSFIGQRIRWVSKAGRFSDLRIVGILFFAWLFNAFIVFNLFYLCTPSEMNWLPLAITGGAKFFCDFLFDIPLVIFFRKIVLLLLLPFVEAFHVLYVIIIGALSLTGRYRWKDRLVR